MTTLNSVSPAPGPAGSDLGAHSDSALVCRRSTRASPAPSTVPNSSEIATTLEQATAAIATAATDAEQARQRALDPLVTAGELAAARTAMDDARFVHERLTAAVSRLRQRLAEVQASEEQARRLAHYRDLEQVRDQLAAELRALYPAFALKLAALLTRIAANDQAIAHVNSHAKPSGLPPLLSAELVAREHGRLRQSRVRHSAAVGRSAASVVRRFGERSLPVAAATMSRGDRPMPSPSTIVGRAPGDDDPVVRDGEIRSRSAAVSRWLYC